MMTNWSLKWSKKIKILLSLIEASPGAHRRVTRTVTFLLLQSGAKQMQQCCQAQICMPPPCPKLNSQQLVANSRNLSPDVLVNTVEKRDGGFRDRGARNSVRMIGKVGAARAWFAKEFVLSPSASVRSFRCSVIVDLLIWSTEIGWKTCTWLREICSCYCLHVLPGPAWVLLSKICILFSRSLYLVFVGKARIKSACLNRCLGR